MGTKGIKILKIMGKEVNEEQIVEIAKMIDKIVDNEVKKRDHNQNKFKYALERLKSNIECELFNCEWLIDKSKKDNLTIKAVEEEGFKRGLLSVLQMVDLEYKNISTEKES